MKDVRTHSFDLEFVVRDYECDLQGIVNHATYLNYLEHTRHQFLLSLGLDFADLHSRGHSLVVTRLEVDYRASLTSGDRFVVHSEMTRESRLRFAFDHHIERLGDRLSDGHEILRARVIGTSVSENGRPGLPPEIEALFGTGA